MDAHRRHLLAQLDRYGERHPEELELVARFAAFVTGHADCFQRTCVPGHVTASAWLLAPEWDRALLHHHRKLGRWLQPGGHLDGEGEVYRAALREAQEESGMQDLDFLDGRTEPLDLDLHEIPARGVEPAHLHYDVRFLLVAAPGQELRRSDESLDLRWFRPAELGSVTREESVLRLQRKAQAWLGER